jgi:hypothetical protein
MLSRVDILRSHTDDLTILANKGPFSYRFRSDLMAGRNMIPDQQLVVSVFSIRPYITQGNNHIVFNIQP